MKDVRPEQLVEAVRMVAAGEALLAPTVTRRLIAGMVQEPKDSPVTRVQIQTERRQYSDALPPCGAK